MLEESAASPPPIILRVLVASFHHRNGNQIDYAFPPFDQNNVSAPLSASGIPLPDELSVLPFLCIPDGAHALAASASVADEDDSDTVKSATIGGCDFVYFQIPIVGGRPIYGISCFRQMLAKDLLVKSDDVTRTMVQKAVVVLTSEPLFGPVVAKLGLVTKSFFDQRDFSKMDVIDGLYGNLKNTFHSYVSDVDLNMGLHLRETVTTFKGSLLQLFKLLLLERRVLFFGTNTGRLGQTLYGLLSLFPGLLRSMCALKPEDAFVGASREGLVGEEGGGGVGGQKAAWEALGLPLKIFNEHSWFQPFISLHQIDLLTSPEIEAWTFGTSNSIFAVQRGANIDAIVNTDTGSIDLVNQSLRGAIQMTGADRAFIEGLSNVSDICDTVIDSWDMSHDDDANMQDPFGDYEGSDNHIRTRFEAYTTSLVVTYKHALEIGNAVDESDLDTEVVSEDLLSDFNHTFLDLWTQTRNHQTWLQNPLVNLSTHHANPGHPNHHNPRSDTSDDPVEFLRNAIAPLQTNLMKGLVQAEAGISSTITSLTSPAQREKLDQAMHAADGALAKGKEVAGGVLRDAGKVAGEVGVKAQEGFAVMGKAVAAGFKDPTAVAIQEGATKVVESVGNEARKLWGAVGAWGGGWLESLTDLQKEEEVVGGGSGVGDGENEAFVVGEDHDGNGDAVQGLEFHEERPGGAGRVVSPVGKKSEESDEVGYSFV
ncbi:late secretory pathway protein avl9 [Podochytrium sp. JEL0797]|nr:late secretory pathway protein avl9 [Podochytrium sp. JEL0797]